MANFFIPVSSRAIIALLTKVSTTDFWKDAATSAGLISSPFIFDKLSWLSTTLRRCCCGHRLIEEDAISALTRELMPLASLITPNLSEAEVLTEHCISNVDTMKAAASELLKFGCGSVLLKGGHLEGDKMCDVLQTAGEDKPHLFISDKIESKNTHGTGCTLSSAIATFLALGYDMPQAVEHAKAYVTKGIHAGKDVHIGEGHGPLNHFYAPVPMKTMK
jgi:hydroxymethylpyrimidine/phosphomethylpyrimidine kinase